MNDKFKKLYNKIKRPVTYGLVLTALAGASCGKSATDKEIARLEDQARLEEARTLYEDKMHERKIQEIQNVKEVKDKIHELNENFREINEEIVSWYPKESENKIIILPSGQVVESQYGPQTVPDYMTPGTSY